MAAVARGEYVTFSNGQGKFWSVEIPAGLSPVDKSEYIQDSLDDAQDYEDQNGTGLSVYIVL